MGSAHKIASTCLRVVEFGCSLIVLGIMSKFFNGLITLGGPADSRLAYAIAMGAIGAFFALVLFPPAKYSYYCFPIDFALFVCWMVCFALLVDVSIQCLPLMMVARENNILHVARRHKDLLGTLV